MYMQSFSDDYKNGITDVEGIYTCTNKKPFINLFNVDSLHVFNEYGMSLGFEAFSDTTAIFLFSDDGINEVYQIEFIVADNGENQLEIVWDPVVVERSQGDKNSKTITRDAGDILIPIEIGELYNYPNPFN